MKQEYKFRNSKYMPCSRMLNATYKNQNKHKKILLVYVLK